jgi:hypothetical protein
MYLTGLPDSPGLRLDPIQLQLLSVSSKPK